MSHRSRIVAHTKSKTRDHKSLIIKQTLNRASSIAPMILLAGLLITLQIAAAAQTTPTPNSSETDAAAADRVHSLPGHGDLKHFKMYAGSVTVNSTAGRSLFYTLAESSSESPDTDPLVIWLNGGPGCSSIGGGFFSELGPFFASPGGHSLLKNSDYAWNNMANVLFLESPAFVGWSNSETKEDSVVGDFRTASDSLEFLKRWLERFPKYKGRTFWLSGESYAGHYVPNLALRILEEQDSAKGDSDGDDDVLDLDFQGFLVGNPWTDAVHDNTGAVQFWHSHGMISTGSLQGVMKYCDPGAVGPLMQQQRSLSPSIFRSNKPPHQLGGTTASATTKILDDIQLTNQSYKDSGGVGDEENADAGIGSVGVHRRQLRVDGHHHLPLQDTNADADLSIHHQSQESNKNDKDDDVKCQQFIDQAMQQAFTNINIYDIYADVCLHDADDADKDDADKDISSSFDASKVLNTLGASTTLNNNNNYYYNNVFSLRQRHHPPRYDPCIGDEVEQYMNRRDVQDAFHANLTGQIPGPWVTCTPRVQYNYTDVLQSMLPVYEKLLDFNRKQERRVKMLIYSGDWDAIVPISGTRAWIRSLNLEVTDPWRAWTSTTGQVAGWTAGHELGLRFASVRGGGHMVPYTQPERAFVLFTRWIHGKDL